MKIEWETEHKRYSVSLEENNTKVSISEKDKTTISQFSCLLPLIDNKVGWAPWWNEWLPIKQIDKVIERLFKLQAFK